MTKRIDAMKRVMVKRTLRVCGVEAENDEDYGRLLVKFRYAVTKHPEKAAGVFDKRNKKIAELWVRYANENSEAGRRCGVDYDKWTDAVVELFSEAFKVKVDYPGLYPAYKTLYQGDFYEPLSLFKALARRRDPRMYIFHLWVEEVDDSEDLYCPRGLVHRTGRTEDDDLILEAGSLEGYGFYVYGVNGLIGRFDSMEAAGQVVQGE